MTPEEVKCQRSGCYLGRHLKYRGRFFCSSKCSKLYFSNTEEYQERDESEIEAETESEVEIGSEIELSSDDDDDDDDESSQS